MFNLKLALFAAGAVAILGGAWWGHNYLVDKGVQQQVEADAKKLAELQRDADLETGRLKGRAEAAEKAHNDEHTANAKFRLEHPVSGGLCQHRMPAATRSETARVVESDARASTSSGTVPEVLPGDPGSSGPPEADVRGMLDGLFARCEVVSGTLREFQSRD